MSEACNIERNNKMNTVNYQSGLNGPTVKTDTAKEVKNNNKIKNMEKIEENKGATSTGSETKPLTPTQVGTGCSLVYNEAKVRKVIDVIQAKFNHTEVSMLNSLLTSLDRQLVMKEIIDGENAKLDVFNMKSDWKPGYVPKPHIPYPFPSNVKEAV